MAYRVREVERKTREGVKKKQEERGGGERSAIRSGNGVVGVVILGVPNARVFVQIELRNRVKDREVKSKRVGFTPRTPGKKRKKGSLPSRRTSTRRTQGLSSLRTTDPSPPTDEPERERDRFGKEYVCKTSPVKNLVSVRFGWSGEQLTLTPQFRQNQN